MNDSPSQFSNLEVISREPVSAPDGPPLLFVHGTGHGAWCWDEHFLPYFASNGFSSHAVSLRGHGMSKRPVHFKWTSVADYVQDLRIVANTLSSPPVLIGHSLGGLVVNKYLEQYSAPAAILMTPSPTAGMFLSGLKTQMKNPWLMTRVTLKRDYAIMYSTPELVKKFLFSEDADIKKIAGHCSKIGPESYRASLESIFNLPRPAKITTKMLVIGAANDQLLSQGTIFRTARALNAECKIFPDIAHAMMLEANWKSVADFMIGWLRKNIP